MLNATLVKIREILSIKNSHFSVKAIKSLDSFQEFKTEYEYIIDIFISDKPVVIDDCFNVHHVFSNEYIYFTTKDKNIFRRIHQINNLILFLVLRLEFHLDVYNGLKIAEILVKKAFNAYNKEVIDIEYANDNNPLRFFALASYGFPSDPRMLFTKVSKIDKNIYVSIVCTPRCQHEFSYYTKNGIISFLFTILDDDTVDMEDEIINGVSKFYYDPDPVPLDMFLEIHKPKIDAIIEIMLNLQDKPVIINDEVRAYWLSHDEALRSWMERSVIGECYVPECV